MSKGQTLVHVRAITTLLSMQQQRAPPGCPPLMLGNQTLTMSQAVSIGLSRLDADEAEQVMVCADAVSGMCLCVLVEQLHLSSGPSLQQNI